MAPAGGQERVYWALLSMVAGVGPARFARLLEHFGSARAAWTAPALALAEIGLDRRAVRSLLDLRTRLDPAAEWRRLEQLGISVLTLDDPAYPPRLREITDAPPILYVLGALIPADEWAVAVVGTRRASAYGRQAAERLVGEVARAGVTIVSGLARGIDTYAHRAALAVEGRTLAVLGSGLDRVYPEENRAIATEIAERGAVVTEFPLGTTNIPTSPCLLPIPREPGKGGAVARPSLGTIRLLLARSGINSDPRTASNQSPTRRRASSRVRSLTSGATAQAGRRAQRARQVGRSICSGYPFEFNGILESYAASSLMLPSALRSASPRVVQTISTS